MCRDPRLVVCCLSGLLLFCASIVLFCTGPLVYKYYNHAIGFKATRCSISTSTHGTTIQSCEGGCVPCTSFKVLYDDSEKMNNSVGLNKSQSIGYLNPDETSIRENGWVRINSRGHITKVRCILSGPFSCAKQIIILVNVVYTTIVKSNRIKRST